MRIGGHGALRERPAHDANASAAAKHLSGTDIDIEVDLGTGGDEQARSGLRLERRLREDQRGLPHMTSGVRQRILCHARLRAGRARDGLALAARVSAIALWTQGTTAMHWAVHMSLCCSRSRPSPISTFEIAIRELGGESLRRSRSRRSARRARHRCGSQPGRWVKCVVMRTFAHSTLRVREGCARLNVINALSDREHRARRGRPSEAEGSLGQVGRPDRRVRRRWQTRGDVTGTGSRHAGHDRSTGVAGRLRAASDVIKAMVGPRHGAQIRLFEISRAVKGAEAVYTDVWTSWDRESRRRSEGSPSPMTG